MYLSAASLSLSLGTLAFLEKERREGSAKSAKGDSELGLGERVGIAFSSALSETVDNQTVTEHPFPT